MSVGIKEPRVDENQVDISGGCTAPAMTRLLLDEPIPRRLLADEGGRRSLTIRAADCDGQRSSAHILVKRMYATRGYATSAVADGARSDRVTLVASDHDFIVGTITVGLDGEDGLLADQCFEAEVQQLRHHGIVLCEFIKLAVDGLMRSKKMLASLMHAALIYAREVKGCQNALIEVNPRHVRFYEATLGFTVLSDVRYNQRVDAPAVLMCLDLNMADKQIVGALREDAQGRLSKRSLYHYAFSGDELSGLVRRLRPRS